MARLKRQEEQRLNKTISYIFLHKKPFILFKLNENSLVISDLTIHTYSVY